MEKVPLKTIASSSAQPLQFAVPQHFFYKNDDIVGKMEEDLKKNGQDFHTNANLALAKSLRQNIQETTTSLKKGMYVLRMFDWMLFICACLCLAAIAIGANGVLTANFDLVQFLSALALGLKTAEKVLNLSRHANLKSTQIKDLQVLIRRLSAIEIAFFLELGLDNLETRAKIAADIHQIWELFNIIEYKMVNEPLRGDENPAVAIHRMQSNRVVT